ncbi:hypothetical protein ACET3Z_017351 [Daucus carota]
MHRPKPWKLKLKAKARSLKLKAKSLFPSCRVSTFRIKMFKKKAVVMKSKAETPVSVVQKPKSLKYKIFKILKKLRFNCTENKDVAAEINERSLCLVYKESDCGSITSQCIGETYIKEKTIMCLIIMSHYILKLHNYVGSNKHKFLLTFIISMAMSYIAVMFMRSTDQIEASISGLVWRACRWLMLL